MTVYAWKPLENDSVDRQEYWNENAVLKCVWIDVDVAWER